MFFLSRRTFSLFVVQFALRKIDVDCYVKIANDTILFMLRQTFAFLLYSSAGPGYFFTLNQNLKENSSRKLFQRFNSSNFVSIEMFERNFESVQRVLQSDRQVCVKIIVFPFESRMSEVEEKENGFDRFRLVFLETFCSLLENTNNEFEVARFSFHVWFSCFNCEREKREIAVFVFLFDEPSARNGI